MPTNLYGPGDNFDLQTSHVLPALIRRFHEAKLNNLPSVTLWGTGSPKREFLHVDDLASAALFLMQNYNEKDFVNVGVGDDLAIIDLAKLVASIVGYSGQLEFDPTKPDGTPANFLMSAASTRSAGVTPSRSNPASAPPISGSSLQQSAA